MRINKIINLGIWFDILTLFRPGGGGGGGGGLLRPYKTLKLNNFKTVTAMTTNVVTFPKIYLATV